MNINNRLHQYVVYFLLILTAFTPSSSYSQTTSNAIDKAVLVTVDLKKTVGDMYPMWAWFGYDEPNYTYMKDGKKLLSEIAALSPVPVYVRAHSLMVTGDGVAALKWGSTNMYTEDAAGNPIYSWNIVDSIFDTYVKRGMKPLAQIGFMPEALSTNPKPYRHYWKPGDKYTDIMTGWSYPPKDYNKWRELVYQWVKHCVERYGKRRWKAGIGRCGTNPMVTIGRQVWRSFLSCMIMRLMALKKLCQPQKLVVST